MRRRRQISSVNFRADSFSGGWHADRAAVRAQLSRCPIDADVTRGLHTLVTCSPRVSHESTPDVSRRVSRRVFQGHDLSRSTPLAHDEQDIGAQRRVAEDSRRDPPGGERARDSSGAGIQN